MSPDSSLKRTDHLIWETQSNEMIVCRTEVERGHPQRGLHLKSGQTSWRRWASQGPGKIHSSEQGWKYFLTGEPNSTPVEHQFTLNRRICFWALSFVPLIYMSVLMRLPHWLDHHKLVLSFEVRIFKSSNFFSSFSSVFQIFWIICFIRRNLGSACQFFFYFCKIKAPWVLKGGKIKKKFPLEDHKNCLLKVLCFDKLTRYPLSRP